ncbi:hypothetical protein K439DRAFT_1631064 [Ramaria rubella]|nr:hypothetical protein K439DRAFT_1631064 [Ramaria rubella]
MGMARLLGQLALPASVGDALPLLQRAATLASTDVPQPAYVYGLILLGEFSHVRVEDRVIAAFVPPGGTPVGEARKWVERAAYLGFAPAQYKVGHAYEYAVAPFPFDPLLSVQYYSLASQQGEPEADMALSKWFLCGAEGAFEKDEGLAVTFADKAARKGLGSAEFAMGYYAEVGVGGRKDVDAARRWYAKAVDHGNADAPARLAALSQPQPQPLSRTEHDQITDVKLVRKRTQAKMSAAAEGRHAATASAGDGGPGMSAAQRVVESVRAQEGRGAAGGAGAGAGLEGVAEALEEEERGRESTVSPVQYQHTVNPPTPHSPPPQHAPHAFHPPQNAPSNLSPHAHQGPGPAQAQGYHSPPPPQQQGPQGGAGPQLQYANPSQPRYSLVDGPAPAGSGTPPLNPHRAPSAGAGGGRAAGRPPGRRQGSMGTPGGAGAAQAHAGGEYGAPGPGANGGGPSPGAGGGFGVPHAPAPAAAGPATFAEMGFQTGKAQEKECVIM